MGHLASPRSERATVDDMGWNKWTACIGTSGRHQLERVDVIAGIRIRGLPGRTRKRRNHFSRFKSHIKQSRIKQSRDEAYHTSRTPPRRD